MKRFTAIAHNFNNALIKSALSVFLLTSSLKLANSFMHLHRNPFYKTKNYYLQSMPNISIDFTSEQQAPAANHELATPWLVFTALDGMLVDPFNYCLKPADRTLQALKTNNIPVIFNSNRTFSELIEIRKIFENEHPFIIENGSAICVPKGYFKSQQPAENIDGYSIFFLGYHYSMVIQKLHRIRTARKFNFAGFYDWSRAEVAQKTGLNQHLALLNQQRLCSEPILWHDTALQFELFKTELEKNQLTLTSVDNFYLINGKTDKASAMQKLKEKYQYEHKNKIRLFALSNAINDISMLEQADFAGAISKEKSPLKLKHSRKFFYTKQAGISGWNEAIEHFLQETYEQNPEPV